MKDVFQISGRGERPESGHNAVISRLDPFRGEDALVESGGWQAWMPRHLTCLAIWLAGTLIMAHKRGQIPHFPNLRGSGALNPEDL